MINQQSYFFTNRQPYFYKIKSNKHLDVSLSYALISKDKIGNIRFLFYPLDSSMQTQNIILPIVFKAYRAKTIYKLIELHSMIFTQISTSHAFYLGLELMKAECAIIMEHSYIQN